MSYRAGRLSGEIKKEVADIVVDNLTKIQNKYNEIINSKELDEILDNGKNKMNEYAKAKYEDIRKKVGLGR